MKRIYSWTNLVLLEMKINTDTINEFLNRHIEGIRFVKYMALLFPLKNLKRGRLVSTSELTQEREAVGGP